MARVAELEAKLNLPPKTPNNFATALVKAKANQPEKAKKWQRLLRRRKLAENRLHTAISLPRSLLNAERPLRSAISWKGTPTITRSHLPEIKPVVTRVNIHSGACRHCGKRIAGAPVCCRAARSARYRRARHLSAHPPHASYNRLVEMFKGLFGRWFSEALHRRIYSAARTHRSLEAGHHAEVPEPAIASARDFARVEGRCWQWRLLGHPVAHRIAASRGKAVSVTFLEDATPEVWVSDRLGAQMNHATAHQVCLAHLLRDSRYAIEAGDKLSRQASTTC